MACFISMYFSFLSNQTHLQGSGKDQNEIPKFLVATLPNVTTPRTVTGVPIWDPYRSWFNRSTMKKGVYDHKKHKQFSNILLNSPVCANSSIDLLVYVQSDFKNFARRQIFRETWAGRNVFTDIKVRIVFILGRTTNREEQLKVVNEMVLNGDIVQGDFVESFKNLTYKAILSVRWINDYCSQARYVLKVDDDVFVNIFLLLEMYLPQIFNKQHAIVCHLKLNGTHGIERRPTMKWAVPANILKGLKFYPQFCSGYAILLTGSLIPELYSKSFISDVFANDDVYMYGVVAGLIKNITYIPAENVFTLNQNSALEEYSGNGNINYIVASAWEQNAAEKLWTFTLDKLTHWAKMHSSHYLIRKRKAKLLKGQ